MAEMSNCGGCAEGFAGAPSLKHNYAGKPAIAYRIGTHQTFKTALLSRLSTSDFPALLPLTTRSGDDFTVAACDTFSVLADVITFYQERIANESYLRTAIERRSVAYLGRLIGYQLTPGLAATTKLAFTLETAPGAPALAAQQVQIPAGTRVQSVPDPGQLPQIFETVAAITGRVEWNAIPVQRSERLSFEPGMRELYFAGTNTQVQPGDVIGLISRERELDPTSMRWDVRALDTVEIDAARNVTRVTWTTGLGANWSVSDSAQGVRVFAFRQRAALFGHNAPDPTLLKAPDSLVVSGNDGKMQWKVFSIPEEQTHIDLDAIYPKAVAGSWVALIDETAVEPDGWRTLRFVELSTQLTRADFALSAKVTRLKLESSGEPTLDKFSLRSTQVAAQSEELPLAPRPLRNPLYGDVIALDRVQDDLVPDKFIAVSGKRQRVVVGVGTAGILFLDASRKVSPGESFYMRQPPERRGNGRREALASESLDSGRASHETTIWHLEANDGKPLTVEAPAGSLFLAPSLSDDKVISEVAAIATSPLGVTSDAIRTTVTLKTPLANCYERSTVSINANVALATHGETVGEIAGGGDLSATNQAFLLKQTPLTFVSSAAEPGGRVSTLEVRVNDVLWHEVPTLYGSGPLDRVYTLAQSDDDVVTIQFGDGVNGARLPRGHGNVRLRYRKGIGASGNLRPGQLSMLVTRPLGVKSVTNPAAATGGQDAELLADARRNAPLPVLTFGRAVSVRDYVDYARSFAGVAKAYGLWISDARCRGIHLTVAGQTGVPIPPTSDTFATLVGAVRRYGDPLVPLSIKSYVAVHFQLSAMVKVDVDAESEKVLQEVADALRSTYSFELREFAQPVTIDEIYATIHGIPGVVAADVRRLRRGDAPLGSVDVAAVLPALPIIVADDGSATAAELLTLDPTALELGVMS